jgi:hypothetical protein
VGFRLSLILGSYIKQNDAILCLSMVIAFALI